MFNLVGLSLLVAVTQPLSAAIHRLSADEVLLFKLISKDKRQARKSSALDPILCKAARDKAIDMAKRNYFAHTDPSGKGPNWKVTRAGYVLPSFYDTSATANSMESIQKSPGDPASALALWKKSPTHRVHILGETPFFRDQVSAGVGIYKSKVAPHYIYYVFLSAPKNLSTKPPTLILRFPKGQVSGTTRPQSVVTLSESPLMQFFLGNQ